MVALGAGLLAPGCMSRDADVPVEVVFPDETLGTPVLQDVQSFRLSIRKGTPGTTDMTILEEKVVPVDDDSVSFRGLRGGRDRFVVLEGLDVTPEELDEGATPVVLARGSTVPADYLPGGVDPPASGEYGTAILFFGRVGEMSALPYRLQDARAFFASAELPGGDLAIAGGIGIGGGSQLVALSTTERFDRGSFSIFGGGVMTSARAYPAAAPIGSRGVLVGGGVAVLTTSMAPLATAERLDEEAIPAGQALSMGSPRMFSAAVAVRGPGGERQALLAGGANSWNVTDADGRVERWEGSQFVPYQPMLIARAGLAAAPLEDGTALLTGGYSHEPFGAGTIAKVSDSAEHADPARAGSPYEKVSGMRPHWAHTATALPFGDILVAGGASAAPDAFGVAVATTAADLFLADAINAFTQLPPMSQARAHHAAAPLPDEDAVLVCGGAAVAGARLRDGNAPLGSCEILANRADGGLGKEWRPGPSLLVPRYGHAMHALPDGSVLVLGGAVDGGLLPTAIIEVYTPVWPEPE